jgi:hypothetical protein
MADRTRSPEQQPAKARPIDAQSVRRTLEDAVRQPADRELSRVTHALGQFARESRPWGITDMDLVAEAIRAEALDLTRLHRASDDRAASRRDLMRDPALRAHFKRQLAVCVAAVIGASDARVLSVFTYDLANPPLHLLVLVSQATAGLAAFLASLDRSLLDSLEDLHLPEMEGRESILDVHVITPKEVRLGIGYAALLSAVFTSPIKIWKR